MNNMELVKTIGFITCLICCSFTSGLLAQNYSKCVVYLSEPVDSIVGQVDLNGNGLFLGVLSFLPSGEATATNLPIRNVAKVDVYEDDLLFIRIPYNYLDKSGNEVDGSYRLGQVIYSDPRFDLVKLKRLTEEFEFDFIKGMNYVYYVLDKQTDNYYKLDIEEEIYSGYQYKRTDKYKYTLNYILRDWVGRDKYINRVKYHDSSLIKLFVGFASQNIDGVAEAYIYEEKNDKNFVSKSLFELGYYPEKIFEPFSNSVGLALSYTYERNQPRKNKYRYDQLGVEFISSTSTFFNSEFKYENINVVSLYFGNRFLLTKNSERKMNFSLSFGLSNYVVFSAGQRGRAATISTSPGMTERVFIGIIPFNQLSLLPFNVRIGPQISYGKLSISAFGDISLFERLEYIVSPIGAKIGYSF
ncbi:MAG: hypothetical protein AAF705_00060 [Bacteroidota bacterium]